MHNINSTLLGGKYTYVPGGISYTPSVGQEYLGQSTYLSIKYGKDNFLAFKTNEFNGLYTIYKLRDKLNPVNTRLYGYNNLHLAQNDDYGLMDFNRDGDQLLNYQLPNLPTAYATYDIYKVSGQGVSGTFRPFRTDIGMLKDMTANTITNNANFALEFGPGEPVTHLGFSLGNSQSTDESKSWKNTNMNSVRNDADFYYRNDEVITGENSKDENYFYKFIGDNSPVDKDKLDNYLLGFGPSYVDSDCSDPTSCNIGETFFNKVNSISAPTYSLDERVNRTKSINNISYAELGMYSGIYQSAHYIKSGVGISFPENATLEKPHYTCAFEVINENGLRYIYALPVYNTKHIECSYSLDKTQETIIDYFKVKEVEKEDGKSYPEHDFGIRSLERKEIPAYISTYLLTAIVGTDYIDIKNDGPTDDDLGYWVKFTYQYTGDYNWRAPFTGASFIEGDFSKRSDDIGQYMYGTRQEYYLTQAETQTHIAIFNTSEREDGRCAKSEYQDAGTIGDRKVRKLDSIALYAKTEYVLASNVPIKKINFIYQEQSTTNTAQLCKGIENATSQGIGKLTLKELYSTYRNNQRGVKNVYQFIYSDINPDYNGAYNDRWGNYQDNSVIAKPNVYFPYTIQDKSLADNNAKAWVLNKIILPTGAAIHIDYESDDYAYLQNLPAAKMSPVVGTIGTLMSGLYNISNSTKVNGKYAIIVNIDPTLFSQVTTSVQKEEILNRYLPPLDNNGKRQLYFKAREGLKYVDNKWQYADVTGYLDISSIAFYPTTTSYSQAQILVDNIEFTQKDNKEKHPFMRASWNYMQNSRQDLFGKSFSSPLGDKDLSGTEIAKTVLALIPNIAPFMGISRNLFDEAYRQEYGKILDLNNSYVRLCDPRGFKYGGGSRVKELKIINPDEPNNPIGQVYDYTTFDPAYNRIISSGVAINEPMIGGDETVLRWAKKWSRNIGLRTQVPLFYELPYDYFMYPSASIGYSKVTVKSIGSVKAENNTLPDGIFTTGATIYEFYTSKDFPTYVDCSELTNKTTGNFGSNSLKEGRNSPVFSLVKVKTKDMITASQGYYIENNDMHGKAYKISNYEQFSDGTIAKTPFSTMEYFYKEASGHICHGQLARSLDNNVLTINSYGKSIQTNQIMGIECEHYVDVRSTNSKSISISKDINPEIFKITPIILILPFLLPNLNEEVKIANLVVSNKIVHKYGILDYVKATENGAVVETHNEVFDGTTGAPIITSVNNEYKEKIFTYNIPTHSVYENLGSAASNISYIINSTCLANSTEGQVFTINRTKYPNCNLIQGDEVMIYTASNTNSKYSFDKTMLYRGIFSHYIDDGSFVLDYIQGENPIVGNSYYIKVIRSARRNVLDASVGSISTLNVMPVIPTSSDDCTPQGY